MLGSVRFLVKTSYQSDHNFSFIQDAHLVKVKTCVDFVWSEWSETLQSGSPLNLIVTISLVLLITVFFTRSEWMIEMRKSLPGLQKTQVWQLFHLFLNFVSSFRIDSSMWTEHIKIEIFVLVFENLLDFLLSGD